MKQIKNAFTLMEIMICIIIIAIVSVITIITSKPSDKYNNLLYKRAYDSLSIANYNIVANLGATPYPSSASGMCTALTAWINSSSSFCSSKTVSILGNNSDFVYVDPLINTNIQFVATNNMSFYIAKLSDGSVSKTVSGTATNGLAYSYNTMVVVVDLNGDRKPNTAVYTGKNMPDIVAFVLLSNGEVVPLGVPEKDLRYMAPRVLYRDGITLSAPMSYYDAKCKAWGSGTNGAESKSIDFYAASALNISSGNFVRPSSGACSVDSTHCTANTATTTSNCKVVANNYNNN